MPDNALIRHRPRSAVGVESDFVRQVFDGSLLPCVRRASPVSGHVCRQFRRHAVVEMRLVIRIQRAKDNNIRQSATVEKRIVADVGNGSGNRHVRQRAAKRERRISYLRHWLAADGGRDDNCALRGSRHCRASQRAAAERRFAAGDGVGPGDAGRGVGPRVGHERRGGKQHASQEAQLRQRIVGSCGHFFIPSLKVTSRV